MEEQVLQRLRHIEQYNHFFTYNFMRLVSVEQDRVEVALDVREESKNPQGIVHGGALYTLADNATGIAVHTDGRVHVTQNGQLHFLANQTGGTIRAIGTIRRRGRLTTLAEVEILGENDRLLATGQFSFFCVSELDKNK